MFEDPEVSSTSGPIKCPKCWGVMEDDGECEIGCCIFKRCVRCRYVVTIEKTET
jgi:hypothetical protein